MRILIYVCKEDKFWLDQSLKFLMYDNKIRWGNISK